ncbi:MAG: hypothetical protein AB8G96_15320 [Phycisphaerales bacterium]
MVPKLVPALVASLLIAAGLGGCGGGKTGAGTALLTSDGARDLDLGSDWEGGRSTSTGAGEAPSDLSERSTYWTILLQTFPADSGTHREAATRMVQNAASLDPRLQGAAVYTDRRGSLVTFGRYGSAEDPSAQRDLNGIKNIVVRGTPVFPRALLTRIRASGDQAAVRGIDLLSVRRERPRARSLYTLQVGVWGDFESGELTWDAIRRQAEADVRTLRNAGYESYVHHDEDLLLSMICVGIFDGSAVDSSTGRIVDQKLRRLMREFPSHMVNGDELLEFKVSRVPKMGTRIQSSRVVLVPDLP